MLLGLLGDPATDLLIWLLSECKRDKHRQSVTEAESLKDFLWHEVTTKHWILNNIMGLSFCLLGIRLGGWQDSMHFFLPSIA